MVSCCVCLLWFTICAMCVHSVFAWRAFTCAFCLLSCHPTCFERTRLLNNNEATMLPGGARLNVEGVAIMGDSKIELAVVRSLLFGHIRLVTRNGCLIVRLAPTRLGAAHRPLMTTSLDSALVGWRCWLGPFCHGHLLLGPDSTTRL